MKITTILGIAILLFSLGLLAQTATRTVILDADASVTPGVSGYDWMRAPCTGTVSNGVCSQVGTYVKLNANPTPLPTFSDSTAAIGQDYDYYAIARCPTTTAGCGNNVTGNSDPSNRIAVIITAPRPSAPANLRIRRIE